MEQVVLDLIPAGAKGVCHVSQNDIGRTIRFNLVSGGTVYTLAGTETIKVHIKKPDGTTAERNIANTSSTYVDWVTGEGDCDVAGKNECELVITSGTTVIGSKNFTMKVEEDPYNGQGVVIETAGPAPIATFNTNIVDNVVELKANINPLQDLHGYDHPWIAGGGNNKLPLKDGTYSLNTVTVTINNGKATVSGTATGSGGRLVRLSDVFTLKAGTYYIDGNTTLSGLTPFLNRNSDNTTVNNGDNESFTLSQDTDVFFGFNIINGYTYNGTALPMVNLGSSALPWEPYSNVCPIVGHSELNLVRFGANIWDEEWENGNIDGNTGAKTSDNRMIRSKNYIPCVGNTQFKEVIVNGNTNQMVLYFYDKDKNFIPYTGEGAYNNGYNSSVGLPTTPVNAAYMLFRMTIDYGDTYTNKIAILYPSTLTNYAPFNGQTFTVAFGLTVYGGVYYANRGKITLTWGSDDLGSMNYVQYVVGSKVLYKTSETVPMKVDYNDPKMKCAIYTPVSWSEINYGTTDAEMGKDADGHIFIYDTRFTSMTPEQVKSTLSGEKLVYELATPIEIDVSALSVETLMGSNNVFHNCNGDTEVKYLYNA